MNTIHTLIALAAPSSLPQVSASTGTVQTIFNIVFGIVGGIAVFMVSLGAFQLVMSKGNPEAANKARNTIIYAIVGLVIVLMGFSIVNFVQGKL